MILKYTPAAENSTKCSPHFCFQSQTPNLVKKKFFSFLTSLETDLSLIALHHSAPRLISTLNEN